MLLVEGSTDEIKYAKQSFESELYLFTMVDGSLLSITFLDSKEMFATTVNTTSNPKSTMAVVTSIINLDFDPGTFGFKEEERIDRSRLRILIPFPRACFL
jgi:hypothetical protein